MPNSFVEFRLGKDQTSLDAKFLQFLPPILACLLKRRHLPPGPMPLPLIGNMLEIKWNEPGEYCFLKWRKKYGDVFTYWMGELPIVCICDYAKMVETFQKDGDAYAGRQTFQKIADLLRGGIFGLVFSEGELWEEQKKFTMHVLKNDFGIGNNGMQERILNEIVAMFEKINGKIEQQDADEVNIGDLIDVGIGSIINNILFGYRFDDEDKLALFQEVKDLLNEQNRLFLQPISFMLMTSWLIHCRNFILFKGTYKRMHNSFSQLYDVFDRQIHEHLSEIDLNNNLDSPPRDYVEAFLREKVKKDATGEEHFYTLQQLKGVCHDLWFAGQETTSVTLAWGIAYLIRNPKVIKRLQVEFDANIGSDRLITVADRSKLQYTNAVINEIQRVANVLPQNIPHKMTKNVTIDGHFIPKGTSIVPQMCVLMIDKDIFSDPTEFRPDRFLDENGKFVRINELIPFSIGKRQCLGESLARMELFLFIANIFNQYEITSGKCAPSLERKLSGNIPCPAFTCKIKKRF